MKSSIKKLDYMKKYGPMYRFKHSNERKKYVKLHTLSIKILIFQIYSKGKMNCKKCGYDNIDALSIDHIHNNGAEHRKQIGILNGGQEFYMWLMKNKFPNGYQVLCLNCQMLKKLESKLND